MNQDLSKLNNKQIAHVAVGYLMQNPSQLPEELRPLAKKLRTKEIEMAEIYRAMKEAEQTIKTLQPKTDQLFGALGTISELISEGLPADKILEWAGKYDPKAADINKVPEPLDTTTPSAPKNGEMDIAGSTSKTYNEENPVKDGVAAVAESGTD